MKKIIVFLSLFVVLPLFSKGFDFSVGGSYGFGYQYSFYKFNGLYEKVAIPISFSYYPGVNDIFSLGFKNKIGYGTVVYDRDYNKKEYRSSIRVYDRYTSYSGEANYNSYPVEPEIYENLSFLIKVGKSVKFVSAFGCAAKYSFLNISEGIFHIDNKYDYSKYNNGEFSYITPGFYTYFSIGPALELSLEIINKPKTFSMDIGIPVEFLLPMNSINFTKMNVTYIESQDLFVDDTVYVTKERYDSISWGNFSIGLELTFSFYTFKSLQ